MYKRSPQTLLLFFHRSSSRLTQSFFFIFMFLISALSLLLPHASSLCASLSHRASLSHGASFSPSSPAIATWTTSTTTSGHDDLRSAGPPSPRPLSLLSCCSNRGVKALVPSLDDLHLHHHRVDRPKRSPSMPIRTLLG